MVLLLEGLDGAPPRCTLERNTPGRPDFNGCCSEEGLQRLQAACEVRSKAGGHFRKRIASTIAIGKSPRQTTPTVKAVSFSKICARCRYKATASQLPFATEACSR